MYNVNKHDKKIRSVMFLNGVGRIFFEEIEGIVRSAKSEVQVDSNGLLKVLKNQCMYR